MSSVFCNHGKLWLGLDLNCQLNKSISKQSQIRIYRLNKSTP